MERGFLAGQARSRLRHRPDVELQGVPVQGKEIKIVVGPNDTDAWRGERPSADPTSYALGGNGSYTDPRVRRLNAYSSHGNRRLNMPFMTQVTDDLWHGGCERGLVLPEFVDFKLSLYQWEDYKYSRDIETRTVEMYDSLDQTFDQVTELAEWVNERRKKGTVFVHCQAGLNRSSLVVGKALILNGDVSDGNEAVELIRAKRDPACLVNPAFESWLRTQ